MPVTAKFSERFYAQLGHDVAEELVDWFNMVDTTYHAELRAEILRLEERMGTALAELRAELIKWMFLFWVGTLGTLIALLKLWV